MTAKLKKSTKHTLKQLSIGVLFVAVFTAMASFGSITKRELSTPLLPGVNNEYNVSSVDELSKLYIMSQVAENNTLASSSVILSSYYSAKVQYTTNQYSSTANKIEKPVITDVTGVSKGVISYVVQPGETMESIIRSSGISGLTTDLVRWSNNLKTTNISEGNTIYLPSVAGIVHVVKAGETPATLAAHYSSNASAICSANYLGENCRLSEGLRVVLPGGTLPRSERPEYVAPVIRRYTLTYTSNNPYVAGQCTWYAWQWRHNYMPKNYDLPSNLGNARTWGVRAAGAFVVNRAPAYGAVFVAPNASRYGHVGIVTAVNSDGSITITDMNGPCGTYCVRSGTIISRSEWINWSFIHQRIGT